MSEDVLAYGSVLYTAFLLVGRVGDKGEIVQLLHQSGPPREIHAGVRAEAEVYLNASIELVFLAVVLIIMHMAEARRTEQPGVR